MQEEREKLCEVCEVFDPDPEIVEMLRREQLEEETVRKLAEVFKILGDPTRIKIINALRRRELCVCDLSELLGMSSSAISHQLRVLRGANLVKYRREGRSVYYSLDDEHVLCLFRQGLQHIMEDR